MGKYLAYQEVINNIMSIYQKMRALNTFNQKNFRAKN